MGYFDYRQAVLRDRPLTFWMMDEENLPQPADLVRKGVTWTVNGGPARGKPGAGFSRSMGFTAAANHRATFLEGGGISAVNPLDNVTFEAWVRRRATGAVNFAIISQHTNGAYLRFASDALQFLKSQVAVIATATRTTTDLITFHHCVATKAGAASKIYLDGADVTGTVTNATLAAHDVDIHVNNEDGSEYGTQDLTGVAVYAYALSREQVRRHYLVGIGKLRMAGR